VLRIPPILAQAVLVAAIAVASSGIWLYLTSAQDLTPGGILICTILTVAVAPAVEAAVRRVRHGRPRRAHARSHPNTRKAL
jgi:cytochrome c biogenesis factor